jgi:hypothetical protein
MLIRFHQLVLLSSLALGSGSALADPLTDLAVLDLRWDVPASVPSGLPIWDR